MPTRAAIARRKAAALGAPVRAVTECEADVASTDLEPAKPTDETAPDPAAEHDPIGGTARVGFAPIVRVDAAQIVICSRSTEYSLCARRPENSYLFQV